MYGEISRSSTRKSCNRTLYSSVHPVVPPSTLIRAARLAEKETANPEATSMHRAFAESARILDELAAKCERIAKQMKC
jgi:hypothetical protein